jgi:outer membrane protein TolC
VSDLYKVSLAAWQSEPEDHSSHSAGQSEPVVAAPGVNIEPFAPAASGEAIRQDSNMTNIVSPTLYESVITVENCVQIAIVSHPRVLAAEARVAAARNRIAQARALEDPILDNMFWPLPVNSQQLVGGRMQDQMALTQRVPWPEKLDAKASIACREVQIAQAEVQTIQLEIAESVRLAYYELWLAARGAEIITENDKLVSDLIRTSESRYRAGGSQQDVLNAEIEKERLQEQLLDFQGQEQAARAELAALLRQPQTLNVKTEQELSFENLPSRLDVLVATAERCNPALRGLAHTIQRDIAKQRLADLQRYPDFQFGTQYGFMTRDQAMSPVADGIDMISFSAGVTLPIWKKKIRAGVGEAYSDRVSSSQLYESEQLTIEGRIRRLLAEITALEQQRRLYTERIIPRAQQALEIASSEYTVGKTSFVQLTENYQELLAYRLQIVRFEAAIAGKEAQLERTVGCAELLKTETSSSNIEKDSLDTALSN